MSSQMHNLTTLIKRLEAATSRLEDMASSNFANGETAGAPSTGSEASKGVAGTGNLTPIPTQAAPITPLVPASVSAFDELIKKHVDTFISKSRELGSSAEVLVTQAEAVKAAFTAERKILYLATLAKKPDMQTPLYMEILKDLQQQMEGVNSIQISNPTSPFSNHLHTVVEGISMLGWITIEPKPADYVKETMDSAQFYGNRVSKEYKEKDAKHTEWLKAFYAIFRSLQEYIREWHAMGVSWNVKDGIEPKEALNQITSMTSPTVASFAPPPPPPPGGAGGPPPPPPPPPPALLMQGPPGASQATGGGGGGDMGSVFQQLNRGEAVTSGLKKVDPSMQTHKNPSLRGAAAGATPARSDSASSRGKSPAPGRPLKPESMRTKKPARKELEANKWFVENFDNPGDVVEIEASLSHSILISRCNKTTIRVLGKANAISIDSSSRVSLVIDSLVSAVDVIKSPRFEMQVLGTLPTVLLDQVDGASIYLSKDSLHTEIFSSKCSAVNISVPRPDDDYVECPVPEQIVTRIVNGKAVSEIVEHAG